MIRIPDRSRFPGTGVFGAGFGPMAPGVRGIGSGGPNTNPNNPCGVYGQAGTGDANGVEEIMIELNRVGFDGAVSIEWEDNDAEQHAGAKSALANVRRADLPPSGMRHDETLRA